MFRIYPIVVDGRICIPWYMLVIIYGTEICLAAGVYGISLVNTMNGIGAIPEEYMLPLVATIIVTAFVMYVVFYLMAYQERKSKVLAKKAEALEAGEPVDTLAIASIENFHTVYIVAMALGIIVTSAISFALAATILPDYVAFDGVVKSCVYVALATIVVFVLFDKFVGHKIADRTFKSQVLGPLVAGIIAQFEAPAADAEAPAEEPSADEKQIQLIAQLLAELKKQ